MSIGSTVFLKDGFKLEEVGESNPMSVDVVSSTELLSEGQLEEYDYDTEYEDVYKTNISLSEPLRSVGDVKDRLFRDNDGLWKIERNIRERRIDGGEAWRHSDNGLKDTYRVSWNIGDSVSGLALSNLIKGISSGTSTNDSENIAIVGSHAYVRVNRNRLSSSNIAPFKAYLAELDREKGPIYFQYVRDKASIEILSDEYQSKLNNLRSFQDSNYVYTIINGTTDILSENLKPTLHATFKGGGWYSRWKTEGELERHQKELDEKTDIDVTNEINDKLGDMVTKVENDKVLGDITSALNDYLALVDQTRNSVFGLVDENGNPIQDGITKEVEKLLDRAVAIEREMGALRDTWNFEVTQITMGDEGLFVGTKDSTMGILIAPDRIVDDEFIPAGIYFMDGGSTIAFVSGQMMQINRGIFVQSATIGEHKIETIAGGHTIFSWIPK